MNQADLAGMSVDQLVDKFATDALAQDHALLRDDIAAANRLFGRLESFEAELKRRNGDQRGALLRLFKHPNAQVRLTAAKATLAVAPFAARQELQNIADSKEYPQAGNAAMSLRNLDRGIFKPI